MRFALPIAALGAGRHALLLPWLAAPGPCFRPPGGSAQQTGASEHSPLCFRCNAALELACLPADALPPRAAQAAASFQYAGEDPLERFCADTPDADECKVFDE